MPPRTKQRAPRGRTGAKTTAGPSAAKKSPAKSNLEREQRRRYGVCGLMKGLLVRERNVDWEEEEKNLDSEDEADCMFKQTRYLSR